MKYLVPSDYSINYWDWGSNSERVIENQDKAPAWSLLMVVPTVV